jgi:hypothetical protein
MYDCLKATASHLGPIQKNTVSITIVQNENVGKMIATSPLKGSDAREE